MKIGDRVYANQPFSGVPVFTQGVVDEDYGTGFMVAWDLPDAPLPQGYRSYDGVPMVRSGILRDGFDKQTELHFLTPVVTVL